MRDGEPSLGEGALMKTRVCARTQPRPGWSTRATNFATQGLVATDEEPQLALVDDALGTCYSPLVWVGRCDECRRRHHNGARSAKDKTLTAWVRPQSSFHKAISFVLQSFHRNSDLHKRTAPARRVLCACMPLCTGCLDALKLSGSPGRIWGQGSTPAIASLCEDTSGT